MEIKISSYVLIDKGFLDGMTYEELLELKKGLDNAIPKWEELERQYQRRQIVLN